MKLILALLLLFTISGFSQDAYLEGKKLYEQGRFKQAKSVLEPYAAKHPNHVGTLSLLGEIAAEEKKWPVSMEYFAKLRKLKPAVADYHYKYGGAMGMVAKESNKFKALGLIDDIRSAFEHAIELDPRHIGAHWALIEFNLQLPSFAGGSTKKARYYADRLLNISPVDGYLAKGRIAEDQRQNREAEAYFKKALSVGNSKTTYLRLAEFYTKSNQPEKAKSIMEAYEKLK